MNTTKEKKIGIIGGNGKMGRFFLKFFQRSGLSVSVWDRESKPSLKEFCETRDIIIVSVPIDQTKKVIEEVGEYMTSTQCITDVTSLKNFPMEAMKQLPKGKYFGMHPMFAPPVSGKIEGQNIIFCAGNAKTEQQLFKDLFTSAGAFCIDLDPKEHDTIMSLVQGLSHFLDITFIKTLQKSGINVDKIFGSRSPAYAIKMMLAGRTIAQDANLYGNIQMQNPENKKTLSSFLSIATELFQTTEQKDLKSFEKVFEEGKTFLGKYAKKSQDESDLLIDFLAQRILKKQKNKKPIPRKNTANTIGILGPAQTFSHIAGQKFFGKQQDLELYPSIPSLFSALQKKQVSQIFVPLENLLHGSVAESIDGIMASKIPIQAIYEMKIIPSLFASPHTKPEDITQIYSHPQALAQCSTFLEEYFPNASYIPTHSTTNAINEVLHNDSAAAIAAPEMIDSYPVVALESNIANVHKNATRFALLSAKNFEATADKYEGAFTFSLHTDQPGGLEKMLHAFSVRSINLTKIESRPTGEAFGEYIFFVTYNKKIPKVEKAEFLSEIKKLVKSARFLGEYGIFSS